MNLSHSLETIVSRVHKQAKWFLGFDCPTVQIKLLIELLMCYCRADTQANNNSDCNGGSGSGTGLSVQRLPVLAGHTTLALRFLFKFRHSDSWPVFVLTTREQAL